MSGQKKGWPRDAFGKFVLAAPAGAFSASSGEGADKICSARHWQQMESAYGRFGGTDIDVHEPLPAGSVPPPGAKSLSAGSKGLTRAEGVTAMASVSVQGPMAAISTADVDGLPDLEFSQAIVGPDRIDRSFFSVSAPATIAAVSESRVQAVVDKLIVLVSADALGNAVAIHNGLYYLRAASYVDFYSDAVNFSGELKANIRTLLTEISSSTAFLAEGFAEVRMEWAVEISNWDMPFYFVPALTQLLRRYYDTPSLQNVSRVNRTETNTVYFVFLAIYRNSWLLPGWAGQYTAQMMDALEDYAVRLPYNTDTGFLVLNAIYTCGHLRSSEPEAQYQGRGHAIITSAYQTRAADSAPYLECLINLELAPYNSRLLDGSAVNIAGYRTELANRLFPNTYTYDGGEMTFRTPLPVDKVSKLHDALLECRAQFFRLTQAVRPADTDPNSALTLRIYGSKADYQMYHRFLYGLSTDNGGIYIESAATFYTYDRTSQDSIYTLEELTRHEYAHYLDGYYLLIPQFGGTPLYSNNRLTWHSEGLAEYVTGSRRTRGIPMRKLMLDTMYPPANRLAISDLIGISYSSGFGFYPNAGVFFQFLRENHPELLATYFQALYQNDVTGFDILTQGWRNDAALQSEYSAYVEAIKTAPGERVFAEQIPTDYGASSLPGTSDEALEAQVEAVLPGGAFTYTNRRFRYELTKDFPVPVGERDEVEIGRQLDATLVALTPVAAHFANTTGWFEKLPGLNGSARARVVFEGEFERVNPSQYEVGRTSVVFTATTADAVDHEAVIQVSNPGGDAVLIDPIGLSGDDASLFEIVGGSSLSVPAGQTVALTVRLKGASVAGKVAGDYSAKLTMQSSSALPASLEIPVTVHLLENASISLSAEELILPTTNTYDSPQIQLVVSNLLTRPVTVGSMLWQGNADQIFSVTRLQPTELQPMEQRALTISASSLLLRNRLPGLRSAALTLVPDIGAERSVRVSVRSTSSFTSLRDGLYAGLLQDGDDKSLTGGISIKCLSSGRFTGTLRTGGKTYRFAGAFDSSGHATVSLRRKGASSIEMDLQRSEGHLKPHITVQAIDGGGFNATGTLWAKVVTDASSLRAGGTYSFLLSGRDDAASARNLGQSGSGILTLKPSGAATFIATLSDGRTISASAFLRGDAALAIYAPSYGNKGSLSGVVSFSEQPTTDCTGQFRWNSPGVTSVGMELEGCAFVKRSTVLDVQSIESNVNLVFRKVLDEEQRWTLGAGNAMAKLPVSGGMATLRVRADSPWVTGRYTPAKGSGQTPLTIRGVVLQKQNFVGGIIYRAGQAGVFGLLPVDANGSDLSEAGSSSFWKQ